MDIVFRGVAVYVAVLVLVRIRGKRNLSQLEAFDFVLLLIMSEATQQAMLGNDFSVTNGVLVVATLIAVDLMFQAGKSRWATFRRLVSGVPTLLISDGELVPDRMKREAIDEDDLLQVARASQGLESLDQVKYAVLERNGTISIIPQ